MVVLQLIALLLNKLQPGLEDLKLAIDHDHPNLEQHLEGKNWTSTYRNQNWNSNYTIKSWNSTYTNLAKLRAKLQAKDL